MMEMAGLECRLTVEAAGAMMDYAAGSCAFRLRNTEKCALSMGQEHGAKL